MTDLDTTEIKEFLSKPITDVRLELAQVPVYIAQIGYAKATVESALAAGKVREKWLEADLDTEHRSSMLESNAKITEKAVAAAVAQDERLRHHQECLMDLDAKVRELSALQGAMYARHRSLLELSASDRVDVSVN